MDIYNKKLISAKYQFEQLQRFVNSDDLEKINWTVDAFVSIARSIPQYVETKAKRTKKTKLYNEQVTKRSTFKFFKKLRDINIHRRPIVVKANANTDLIVGLTVKRQDSPVESPQSNTAEGTTTITKYYYENNYTHEIIPYAEQYLVELESFIAEAKQVGLI